MIVADASLLVYLMLPTADPRLNEEAREVRQRDSDWWAPPIWPLEFLNAGAGYLRRGLLSGAELEDLFRRAAAAVRVHQPDYARVARELETTRCSAYDLAYVAAARELGVPLVTGDRQVLAEFPGVAVTPGTWLEGAG